MEQLAVSYGQSFGILSVRLRLFSVFGPQLEKQLIYELFCRLKQSPQKLTLQGRGDEQRDWIYVTDAVRAIWMLRDSVSCDSPPVNVGSGEGIDVKTIAQLATEIAGQRTQVDFSGASRKGDPAFLVADTSCLLGLGFSPQVSLRDGLGAVHRWVEGK
jgi:UDP-glucose 4-epimerase